MADIRSDGWEWMHYDNPDFQVQYRKNYIPAHYKLTDVTMHWHDDVEFIYVVQGSTYYDLNDEKICIRAGDGIFVNARQRHVIESSHEDCELYCLIFHPFLLCSSEYIATNMVMPILDHPGIPFLLLQGSSPWQKRILEIIQEMEPYTQSETGHMQLMRMVYEIWDGLYQNLMMDQMTDENNKQLFIMKQMVTFIRKNYRNKITLSQICEAGHVGRTKCNEMFAAYYNLSPIEYLRNYRIEKGAYLLEISDMSITEIAYEVGFNDASYFSKVFGQLIGCSPQNYRSYGKGMSRYYEQSRYPGISTGV